MTDQRGTHERITSDDRVRGSSDRAFGLVFTAVFAIIGLWPLLGGGPVRLWALGVAVLFALAALVVPGFLSPLNRLWTRLGLFLHHIANFVVLVLLFYLVFTPIGLVMRLSGKDPLKRHFDSRSASYWIPREPPGPAPDTIQNQF